MRSRRNTYLGAALAMMLAAGVSAYAPAPVRERALTMPLEWLPVELAGWTGTSGIPADSLPLSPNADERLLRTYRRGHDTVWVAVEYYRRQNDGRRPHALNLIFPGRGWSAIDERAVALPPEGSDAALMAKLVIRQVPGGAVVTTYWYQLGAHTLTSEFRYRWKLLSNSLFHQRSDGALVRIVSPVPASQDASTALDAQRDFVKAFHPELSKSLPR